MSDRPEIRVQVDRRRAPADLSLTAEELAALDVIPVADVEAAIQRVTDALATWSDFQQIDNWVAFCNGHKHALDELRSELGLDQ